MAEIDTSAAHHEMHVKLETRGYTIVSDWCASQGNDSKLVHQRESGKKTWVSKAQEQQ